MGFYALQNWLNCGFLDVFIAYCLLIASFSAFLASKYFDIFCLILSPSRDDLFDYLRPHDVVASICDREGDDECSCCLWQRELVDQYSMKISVYKASDSAKMKNHSKSAQSCFPLKRRRKESNYSDSTSPANLLHCSSDQANTIRLLEKKLQEAEAARMCLQEELEKERSSAAIAADEAMAMIQRLQDEKAATAMKARQFQRITEEKSAYDTEEMDILKEILRRREIEKLFLEKELEDLRSTLSATKDCDFDDIETPRSISNRANWRESMVQRSLSFNPESQSNGSPWLLRRNSMSDLDYQKTALHNEVGLLRERLKTVQEGKEKLSFSAGYNMPRVKSFNLSSECRQSGVQKRHRLARSG